MSEFDFVGAAGACEQSALNRYDTPKLARMPTLQERIDMAVAQAKERLAQVERAREILARNPDLEELLNIMQTSHF